LSTGNGINESVTTPTPNERWDELMDCRKGESEHKAKVGRYRCKQCGAVSKKKSHVCKPKKIKDGSEKGDQHG
jgi:hypothetical protein